MRADERRPQADPKRRGDARTLFVLGSAAIAALAFASIGYLLRPPWTGAPPPVVDAPPLPIVVAGVVFNVPPAAVRIAMQRRAGPQERIDLAYQWPALTPPPAGAAGSEALLFVTLERSQETLTPAERLKSIYPRYIEQSAPLGATGLIAARFRDGSPYEGEDVVYDPAHPDRFLVRCNRERHELVWAMCLFPRPAGSAALTFRFPRAWLADWRDVEAGIGRLIESWRPAAR